MPSENEHFVKISKSNLKPSTSYYTEESLKSEQLADNAGQLTRMTKRTTKQWTSSENNNNKNETRENSYTPLFQRNVPIQQQQQQQRHHSFSKSPSPNFNTLHRKGQLHHVASTQSLYSSQSSQLPPKIKLNLSLAPHLKLRESEIRSSVSPAAAQLRRASSVSSNCFSTANEYEALKRGASPFTFIETTSIKKKPVRRRSKAVGVNKLTAATTHYQYFSNDENLSSRSTPPRLNNKTESHKTLLLTQISPNIRVPLLFCCP
jgi:hypothetical protein